VQIRFCFTLQPNISLLIHPSLNMRRLLSLLVLIVASTVLISKFLQAAEPNPPLLLRFPNRDVYVVPAIGGIPSDIIRCPRPSGRPIRTITSTMTLARSRSVS
jgi:hypothetical protein